MNALQKLLKGADRQSPTLLAIMAGVGLFGSVALAIRATPKAMEDIEAEQRFRHEEYSDDRPLEPLDVVKVTWKRYIPTASVMITTLGCIAASNAISANRITTMASIITLTEGTLNKYQKAVLAEVGDKKENKIRGRMVDEELKEDDPSNRHVIQTNQGATLCRDGISGRYFYSDKEFIMRTVNEFNKRLFQEMSIPLNEFYADLYLPSIDIGGQLGWDVQSGILDLELIPGETPDGILCAVLVYKRLPVNIWG